MFKKTKTPKGYDVYTRVVEPTPPFGYTYYGVDMKDGRGVVYYERPLSKEAGDDAPFGYMWWYNGKGYELKSTLQDFNS